MPAAATSRTRVEIGSHTWELRDVEFEDTATVRRFECVDCGAVRYE